MADEPPGLHRDRDRASSFGAAAALYDRTRPRYPEALLDAIGATRAASALDVGCGTGILAGQLAARGLAVTCVEPDPRMAEVARAKGLDVEIGAFEAWEPAGRSFDVVTAGQSWHWVEPVAGAAKAAEALAAGGTLVLAWNVGLMDPALRERLDVVYAQVAPGLARPTVLPVPDEWLRPGGSEHALVASGRFAPIDHEVFSWERGYTTDEWLAILGNHSDHLVLATPTLEALLDAVRATIDQFGGAFEMHYDCRAAFARRS